MSVVRNSIEIAGISPEDKLPFSKGKIIEYCETEDIHIPDESSSIGQILKIEIGIDIKSNRVINVPNGKVVVLDGVKKIRIIYSERHRDDKANIIQMKLPYNTFIEFKNDAINLSKIKIHIADAYFSLLDSRRIYSHILYIIDVPYISQDEHNHKDLKAMTALNEITEEIKVQFTEGKTKAAGYDESEDIEAVTNLNDTEENDDIKDIIPKMSKIDWNSII